MKKKEMLPPSLSKLYYHRNLKVKMYITSKTPAAACLKRLTGFDVFSCPKCNKGRMMEVELLPRIRSPGWITNMLQAKYTHK